MNTQNKPVLALCDLENYDPRAPQRGNERRFCCPLCGDGKPKDGAHRCLAANTQDGAWKCHRCGAVGKLREHWQAPDRAQRGGQYRAQQSARRAAQAAFELPTAAPTVATAPADYSAARPLVGTRGADYLSGRGVPPDVAALAGVRFATNWGRNENSSGGPAVVFPLCDRAGNVIAAQGRYIADRKRGPNAITHNAINGAIFSTAGALDWLKRGAPLVVTEAPIDALSIAVAGFPAFAFCGCNAPRWLHLIGGLRRVLIATDADPVGDAAAAKIAANLRTFGATCQRLRPEGAKDWNEFLTVYGADALTDYLAPPILIDD